MTIYYSPSANKLLNYDHKASYDAAGSWESDAFELTDAQLQAIQPGLDRGERLCNNNGVPGTVKYTPTLTVDEQLTAITYAIQKQLDTTAQSRQYDDIKSACAYASPTPFIAPPNATPDQIAVTASQEKFRIEGNALQAWMSLTWASATQYLAGVTAGTSQMPTVAEAVAMMPTFTWPD